MSATRRKPFHYRSKETGRLRKFKQGKHYCITLKDFGWTIRFQETKGHMGDWGGVHIHVWMFPEKAGREPTRLYYWLFGEGDEADFFDLWPDRLLSIALVEGVEVNDDKEEPGFIVFDDPRSEMELLIKGKLTENIVFHVAAWADLLLESWKLQQGFKGFEEIPV